MADRMCPCGCGATWNAAVREIMRSSSALNREQAEAQLEEVARAGADRGETPSDRQTTPITDTPEDFARALGITPEETPDA